MADKLMDIPNDDTQNNPFCRLKLVVETFKHSTKWGGEGGVAIFSLEGDLSRTYEKL